jgi:hypothetical protein
VTCGEPRSVTNHETGRSISRDRALTHLLGGTLVVFLVLRALPRGGGSGSGGPARPERLAVDADPVVVVRIERLLFHQERHRRRYFVGKSGRRLEGPDLGPDLRDLLLQRRQVDHRFRFSLFHGVPMRLACVNVLVDVRRPKGGACDREGQNEASQTELQILHSIGAYCS